MIVYIIFVKKCSTNNISFDLVYFEAISVALLSLCFRKELVAAAYKYHEEKVKSDTDKRANVKAEQNKMALRTAMDVSLNIIPCFLHCFLYLSSTAVSII